MYYIGIDGGGTKTEGVLCDETGKRLARKVESGSNPNDIGLNETAELLCRLIVALCDEGKVAVEDTRIFAGISGCGIADTAARLEKILQPHFRISVDSDIVNVIEAGLQGREGVVVIAGTGSSFAVSRGNGYTIYGGSGHLFEEGGSGYSVAKGGFIAALNDEDGIGAHTKITQFYQERLGGKIKPSLEGVYKGGKRFIASFAPLVFEAFEQGDGQAKEILAQNAACIAQTLRKIFAASGVERRVALSGGLFKNPYFTSLVTEQVEGETYVSALEQVEGALRRARAIYS